jgi:ATP-dependent Clp protease ATP-binding subunit ClpA
VFERFTESAREAVTLAQAEARALRHGYLGTEHLLLGVANVPESVGSRVLRRMGLDPASIRAEVVRIVGEGPASSLDQEDTEALRSIGVDIDEIRRRTEEAFGPGALERALRPRRARWRRGTRCEPAVGAPAGRAPFTPRAKKVLELSLREAVHLGHRHIGTEHVLLGLVREGQGVAAEILTRGGAEPGIVRRMVIDEMRGPGDASGPLVPSA